MAEIKRQAHVGCLLQAVGFFCLITALLTFWTVIGPMVFGLTGFWLIIFGGLKYKWYECSECGTRLADKKLKICPGCKSVFL